MFFLQQNALSIARSTALVLVGPVGQAGPVASVGIVVPVASVGAVVPVVSVAPQQVDRYTNVYWLSTARMS